MTLGRPAIAHIGDLCVIPWPGSADDTVTGVSLMVAVVGEAAADAVSWWFRLSIFCPAAWQTLTGQS